jgi:hypothetical protein
MPGHLLEALRRLRTPPRWWRACRTCGYRYTGGRCRRCLTPVCEACAGKATHRICPACRAQEG